MEQTFLISQGELEIPCTLSQPDSGIPRRVVLGVHGFGGSMCDEIQAGIAEEMVLFGYACLRFDFPAHGISPLESDCFSLKYCVDVLLTAAREAKARFPQVEDLCIFASGFGAYITLVALDDLLELPGRLRLVVQTPSVRMDQTLLAMTQRTRETLQAMGSFTVAAPRPFDVSYRFYEELLANSIMMDYGVPMLILHGEADDFISMQDIENFHRLNEESELVIIPGASHRFLEPGAWDMVLDLTRDWFDFGKVLLI